MIRLDAIESSERKSERELHNDLCHWFSAALEVGAALADMHAGTKPNITEDDLLLGVRDQISRLFHFDAIAFALVDDENNDFRFSDFMPSERKQDIMQEVNRRIEDGHFAWTLSQIRPVILPTENREVMLLMCTLATRNRVRGMFVGLFSSSTSEISEAALNLLLIILANTSNALESIVLYRLVKQQNIDLEKKVIERTQELEIAMQDADAANRSKSAFIANMSHEIRTPLTSIIGYAELLRHGTVPEAERDVAIDSIARGGRHLLHLVNDILDMSKIESGRIEVEHLEINMLQMLADVESIIAPQAKNKCLVFRSERIEPIPPVMLSDPLRLRQILLNLLGNSVKFTEQGEISLSVRGLDAGRALEIEITDTGIGIPQERQDALFQPFHQADISISRRFGGTGLGLYLARQYADLIGGELTLDKQYTGGTRFRLILPVITPAGAEQSPQILNTTKPRPPSDAIGGRVLVVDDTAENRHLIGLYLRSIAPEVTVEIAVNGSEAVERALVEPYNLILMDWQMPELDGLSATHMLREAGYRGVIAALTASAMTEDRARCIAAGCDDFITKPIDEQDLRRLVYSYLSFDQGRKCKPPQEDIHDLPEFQMLRLEFISELELRIESMQDAFTRHDFDELANLAHKLKGAGGSFGYTILTDSAAVLERATRNDDQPAAQSALDVLRRNVDVIRNESADSAT
jgi:signal transduction histidine kinase/CheY-like chemotaxis protein